MTNPIARALISLAIAGSLVAVPVAALAQDEPTPTDLAAVFPATVGGAELAPEIIDGPAWLDRQDPSTPDGELAAQRTQELVSAVGKSIEDLTVATALVEPSEGNHIAITAVKVAGAEAGDLVRPTVAMLLGDVANPAFRVQPLGSKSVLRVSDADLPGSYPRTVYPFGDTVWVIEAEQPALLELVEALPAEAAEAPADPAPELIAEIPFVLGGEPRSSVSVGKGWSNLLNTAPGEMFGPQFEQQEVDLFLTEGVTIDDLVSVLGVWDVAGGGTFIVGFRVDGADEELMRRLLTEIVLPTVSLSGTEPATEVRQIAGRDLTVVTDNAVDEEARALTTYNLLVAGDTIWMVNLATDDEALLTEAIEGLPAG